MGEKNIEPADESYVMALPVLEFAGCFLQQPTSHATNYRRPHIIGRITAAGKKKVLRRTDPSRSTRIGPHNPSVLGEDDSSTSGCCIPAQKRPRENDGNDTDAALETKRTKLLTDALRGLVAQEQNSPFPIVPHYHDLRQFLPPGCRRKAVNTIYLMAASLNLEICTPSLAVVIMDRYFSAISALKWERNRIVLIAMLCLNIAGKVADLDSGYCGSRSVMVMIRSAVPENLRCADETSFFKETAAIERDILSTIKNTLLSYPCALQMIAAATNWNEDNEPMWLRAALACDVFNTDSIVTEFSQAAICAGVISFLTNPECKSRVVSCLIFTLGLYINKDPGVHVPLWDDRYVGARHRHCRNPETKWYYDNIVPLIKIHCPTVRTTELSN